MKNEIVDLNEKVETLLAKITEYQRKEDAAKLAAFESEVCAKTDAMEEV